MVPVTPRTRVDMSREIHIPSEARAALARGDRIIAIKLVREANHGVDLRAAMEAIDAFENGGEGHVTQASLSAMTEALPQVASAEVIAAVSSGNMVEAVKLVRQQQGLGLKEAKELVDSYRSFPALMRAHAMGDTATRIASQHGVTVPDAAMQALQQGKIFDAIKMIGQEYSAGVKQAKHGVQASGFKANVAKAIKSPTVSHEPARSGMAVVLTGLAIVVAIALWWALYLR